MDSREVLVWLSLNGRDIPVGRLWFYARKGRESASFEYNREWLSHPEKFALDPMLQLSEGTIHTAGNQKIFGAIEDSAPDRWGRVLMRRAAMAQGLKRTLMEADYLLGVNDEARLGALRFSNPDSTAFLTQDDKNVIPPLVALPALLAAADRFIEEKENSADLRLLLAPGSSLGGARPKATIRLKNGSLAMAKFLRKDDEFDTVKWEAAAMKLARNAGISIPDWRLETVQGKPVLIVQRFDRDGKTRIPFLSAMSMLGACDGEHRSYTEIADMISRYGARPEADTRELWRRLIFNILISNTDDHLRNHGFLYTPEGWTLSPAYDLNPVPADLKPRILSTAIIDDDFTASLDTALAAAKYFRLTNAQAREMVHEVSVATGKWRKAAKSLNIDEKAQNRMASAFEHEDAEMAGRL